MTNMLV